MSDEEQFWDEIGPRNPPLSPEQLREWEEQHGIRIPSTLARALMMQNGGCVRETEGLLWIEPLTRFESGGFPKRVTRRLPQSVLRTRVAAPAA
jgi:hypothetical protein